MKEYDYVELITERKSYLDEGVHKGMRGTIMLDYSVDGCWYVDFDGPKQEHDGVMVSIPIGLSVKEKDLKVIISYEPKE